LGRKTSGLAMVGGEVALPAKNLALEPILSLKEWVFLWLNPNATLG
jgi:hypothetical protein